ncbi:MULTISPECIES: AMP-binding protein [Arthrobacter]|uniref:AMP-binding protein n=2 Tax=Arthrobacter TaxID=1663 RepID=A0ABU9KKU5_9MICC|nr:AMP-binding protein [Arthrobacter sp. YJM1]MDP5227526.1 AMP-binding protein [Arthrobacter sp. YJM1]
MQQLDDILKALAAALAAEGPAVDFGDEVTTVSLPAHPEAAVVVRTSGSTGRPKAVVLSAEALAASSLATAEELRAEGQWLLALPLQYVAGVQVLIRSLYAGTRPWAMDLDQSFTPEAFVTAADELTDPIRLTSLVPTQLARLLEDPTEDVLRVLRRFHAILLGGAAVAPGLLARARELSVNVVTTYGSAETSGGCVYNGRPLDGVDVRLVDGRVHLGGPTLADGYLDDPEATWDAFIELDGERFFRTSDLGELLPDGTLRVTGRVDDVINSGGSKVSALDVQHALEALDGVAQAFVGGIPSAEWGQSVAAAVVLSPGARWEAGELAEALRAGFGPLRPRHVSLWGSLPLLPNGKVDRQAILGRLRDEHGGK